MDDTQTIAFWLDKNLWMNVFLEILDVTDDSDLLPDNLFEGSQSLIHAFQTFGTQRAETFVDEDGIGTEFGK